MFGQMTTDTNLHMYKVKNDKGANSWHKHRFFIKFSILGVVALWIDCRDITTDQGS